MSGCDGRQPFVSGMTNQGQFDWNAIISNGFFQRNFRKKRATIRPPTGQKGSVFGHPKQGVTTNIGKKICNFRKNWAAHHPQ